MTRSTLVALSATHSCFLALPQRTRRGGDEEYPRYMQTQVVGEIVSGSGANFALAFSPIPNTLALYGSGIRLQEGIGNDYTIVGQAITLLNGSYSPGQVTADYGLLTSVSTASGVDQLSPFALTTLQRVKDLLFDPNKTILVTGCTITQNSNSITGATVPAGSRIIVGQQISGWGIPSGTTILAISGATLVISQNATLSNTGQTVTVIDQPSAYDAVLTRMINYATNYIQNECGVFSFVQQSYVDDVYSIDSSGQIFLPLRNKPVFSISKFQYRAGTPSNPSWTDFIADQYELIDPRTHPVNGTVWYPSGTIRVYGAMPRIYSNMIRVSYAAGYPVNWANPEDLNTHWLPGDLTSVCENLVVRRFKRRQNAGQSSISIEGATVAGYRNVLDVEDEDVLGQYGQITF
jgi:hypothetical protein